MRTVRRDLALLRERGHVIDADTGAGGGIRLRRERGATAVHLGLDEIANARRSSAPSSVG